MPALGTCLTITGVALPSFASQLTTNGSLLTALQAAQSTRHSSASRSVKNQRGCLLCE